MYGAATEFFNKRFKKDHDECEKLSYAKKKKNKVDHKVKLKKLELEESDDKILEGDKKMTY